ncbi:MAG: PQQ-like beta-propeller repeat protein [Verrucomicrobia subdivision 3 bacterium]|nr:PQQ-like beta-propeller repeat protein [Limisphaerales bacterium]
MQIRGCFLSLLSITVFSVIADDWPQWLGPQRDGVWREERIIQKFDGVPKLRWKADIGGGYAGPAVAKGRVYVLDRQLSKGTKNPANPFARGQLAGTERVLCLNEADGKLLWKHEYDCPYAISYPAGPRCTPTVDGNRVYTLGAMGNLFCLSTENGKVLWQVDFKKDFGTKTPVWGFAAHPLVDGDKLICLGGGEEGTTIAFNKMTGKVLWRVLPGPDLGYCPPMIFKAGGQRQLIIWHPRALNSIDPETGKLHWTEPFSVRSGLSIPTPRLHGDLLFITSFYNGPLMMRLAKDAPRAKVEWRATGRSERVTQQLHAIMCTPFIEDGHIYGVCSYGQFRCIKVATGVRVWETFAPVTKGEGRWANAFIVKHQDRFFIHNEKGDLIIAKLSPKGYEEISRANLIAPTNTARGRQLVWSHPAFANKSIYLRNDRVIRCYSLAE